MCHRGHRSVVGQPPAEAVAAGERVWLDVRGRHVPAVVTGDRAGPVLLRVQPAGQRDAVRIVRGRARAAALTHRESLQLVDGEVRSWRA